MAIEPSRARGRHEIAAIQTTAIDKDAGLLRLTTVLAHASGEWISSEWPVCPIADIASAQRMGAALTYARRYALFTLVGIAGEDALDAPDLDARSTTGVEEAPRSDYRSQSTGDAAVVARARDGAKLRVRSGGPVLTPDQSAIVRERLLGQLAAINSTDKAAAWAHQNLAAKNTLTAGDARIVEEEFQTRLSTIGDGEGLSEPFNAVYVRNVMPAGRADAGDSQKTSKVSGKPPRNSAARASGKTVRLRDKEHRKFVSRQACLVCGRTPSDPHHLTFMQPRALGQRVTDEFTVPVCRIHHRELHRQGDEAAWWGRLHIDPLPVALRLWQHTRLNGDEPAPSDGITLYQAVQKQHMSVQDRAGTNDDARSDVTSAFQGPTHLRADDLVSIDRDYLNDDPPQEMHPL